MTQSLSGAGGTVIWEHLNKALMGGSPEESAHRTKHNENPSRSRKAKEGRQDLEQMAGWVSL